MQFLISLIQDALTCPDLMGELKSALEAEASILIVPWLHSLYHLLVRTQRISGTSWRVRTFQMQSFQDHFDLYNEVHHLLSCPDFKAELEKCEDLQLVTVFLFQSCICARVSLGNGSRQKDYERLVVGLNSPGPGSGVQPCACCAFHLHDGGLSWDVDIRLNIWKLQTQASDIPAAQIEVIWGDLKIVTAYCLCYAKAFTWCIFHHFSLCRWSQASCWASFRLAQRLGYQLSNIIVVSSWGARAGFSFKRLKQSIAK